MPRSGLRVNLTDSITPRSCQDVRTWQRTRFMGQTKRSKNQSDPHVNVKCFVTGVFLVSRTYHFLLTGKPGEGIMTYQMIRRASVLVPCLLLLNFCRDLGTVLQI